MIFHRGICTAIDNLDRSAKGLVNSLDMRDRPPFLKIPEDIGPRCVVYNLFLSIRGGL